MSFEHDGDTGEIADFARQLATANAVRGLPTAEIYSFPLGCIVRPQPGDRGDQVAVTHRGETTRYPSPEAMAAVLRAHDGELHARLAELRALNVEAEANLKLAKALKATFQQRLALLGYGGFVSAGLAAVCALAWLL